MKNITIKDTRYEVVMEFPVLYEGWEMDNEAYVVSRNGNNALVMSTHGRLYFASRNDLEEKVAEYENALLLSKKAISILPTQE